MNRRDLIDFCLTFPLAYEDYPFDGSTGAGVWTVMRHRTNRKSFALIYERHGDLFVNLKTDPLEAPLQRELFAAVTPGYHMNKAHWNTVRLGGDVSDDLLRRMIADSYDRIRPRRRNGKP